MDNWEVSASDDEWNCYNPPDIMKHKSLPYIPEKLAHLFKKIEKILKLSCQCLRVGAKIEVQPANSQSNFTPTQQEEQSEFDVEAMEVHINLLKHSILILMIVKSHLLKGKLQVVQRDANKKKLVLCLML